MINGPPEILTITPQYVRFITLFGFPSDGQL
jgi:hypothetical protein